MNLQQPHFHDDEAARRYYESLRWPDGRVCPWCGVIGEEYGEDRPDAEFVWVLDPIDGTRAFISGLPLWTTLIALRQAGTPSVGVIAQPYLDEIFVGGPSGGGSEAVPPAQREAVRRYFARTAESDPEAGEP